MPTFKIVPEFLHNTSSIGNMKTDLTNTQYEISLLEIFSNLNQGIQEVRYIGCRILSSFAWLHPLRPNNMMMLHVCKKRHRAGKKQVFVP